MLISRVAVRYAKSLLNLSIEMNQTDAVYQDILMVRQTCLDSYEFRVMLNSPAVKSDKKQTIFKQIFGNNLSAVSSKFFDIIIRKKREELMLDICESFVLQYKKHKNIHTVHVESAVALTKESREKVLDFLRSRTKDEIELIEEVDEDLIGGVIVRMEDQQLDASVKSTLNNLEREFSKDLYSVNY